MKENWRDDDSLKVAFLKQWVQFSNHFPRTQLIWCVWHFACMYVCVSLACLVPSVVRGGCQIPTYRLQIAVGQHMGAGNKAWVLWRKSSCFVLLSHLSGPLNILYPLTILKFVWQTLLLLFIIFWDNVLLCRPGREPSAGITGMCHSVCRVHLNILHQQVPNTNFIFNFGNRSRIQASPGRPHIYKTHWICSH